MVANSYTFEQIKNKLKNRFSVLDDAALLQLHSSSVMKEFESNEEVIKVKQKNEGILFLLEGILTVELQSNNQSIITHFIQQGEVFFASECFLNIPYQSSCRSLTKTKVLMISPEIIQSLINKNSEFLIQILSWGSKEKSIFEEHAANLIGLPVKTRFIKALQNLNEKFSEKNYLPIKAEVIGNFISASKSSLFRTLSELEKKQVIKTDKQGIIILNRFSLSQ